MKIWQGLKLISISYPLLCLNLILSQPAIPQSQEKDSESEDENYSEVSISGSRGGCDNQTPSLSWVLPPESQRYGSSNPYLLLYLKGRDNPSHPDTDIIVSLSNSQSKQTIYRQEISVGAKVDQFIPVNLEEVNLNGRGDYIITVMLHCDPFHKSANPWKRVVLKFTPPSAQLQNQLSRLSSQLEQARVLKENQVGYDAIKKVFAYYNQQQPSHIDKKELLETLNRL